MKKPASLLTAALLLTAAVGFAAQPMLNIRLVKLTGDGAVTPGLENIAAIIRRNLPYAGCVLVDQQGCMMPPNATLAFRRGYTVVCSTLPENAIGITIQKHRKMLLSTAVTLQGDSPVIIGGFGGGRRGAKHIFVLQKSPGTE
ncbi:MAG: hypothetical protein ACOX9C_01390 [Kiritimatiellia bacterium]|jgi:hypothetical protein